MGSIKFYREDTGDVLRFAVSFLRAGIMVAIMWAKRRGDRWYREKPGDAPSVWAEKIFFKKIVVRNLYFGRLAIGFGVRRNLRVTGERIRKAFEEELAAVSDPAYREFAVACLKEAPPEFWLYSASTSGRHHPEWARGEGGLVRHTKAAVRVALDLLRAFPELGPEKDAIVVALLLHDTCKINPETGRTDDSHPLLPRKRYEKFADMLPPGAYGEVMDLIEAHMGIWGPVDASRAAPALPERISAALLVHLADYIASREWVSESILKKSCSSGEEVAPCLSTSATATT